MKRLKLLNILQENANISNKEITDLTLTLVYERIKKLATIKRIGKCSTISLGIKLKF
ncbi:winged helix-turn-helix transcriptional regulator [Flavivirga spongiicola]|uniref:winged helix-turn-helix transcriptional regulator n=1 Tax=Flavivirga spongiicola TaxID=421621 RepID=UPI0038CC120F